MFFSILQQLPKMLPLDIVGLTVDSEYEIRVRANCGSGFGDVFSAWSSSYVSWTQTEAPGCALNATPVDGSTTNLQVVQ